MRLVVIQSALVEVQKASGHVGRSWRRPHTPPAAVFGPRCQNYE
jgi:hypothetical protein